MERERREREERDRKERERAKMEMQKERDRQAQEDVDRHFQMSIELAKKVNIDNVQSTHYGEGNSNESKQFLLSLTNFPQTSDKHISSLLNS